MYSSQYKYMPSDCKRCDYVASRCTEYTHTQGKNRTPPHTSERTLHGALATTPPYACTPADPYAAVPDLIAPVRIALF
ncbi:hypothetical protein Cob_v005205 [Colletotrichum orbiculare MAFF 240422]|uniref:Uncharacterized protein n=1 Tax=Colletotrichum orbiculare (strain 104-T / ATCC 96160 / CBS 514.97 / LARS 414 / MAFF 240422) TaxID=1213857 RepID=A0A484FVI6_COLOR|nr:hypothetical protein Cob_v005205 [Colletotrichum orbiculare MAFF 240422]